MEDSTSTSHGQPTMAQIEQSLPPRPGKQVKQKLIPAPDMFSKYLILEGWSHWFFRLGFASIFLINAIYAVAEPSSFSSVLEANPVASTIGMIDFMVKIAIVNDIVLSAFILAGWRKRLVYAWAGLWLIMIAGLKLINLIF